MQTSTTLRAFAVQIICAPLIALAATLCASGFAHAAPLERLQVIATIPDLADVARRIGGDRVDVRTLAKGNENIHRVALRPSSLVAVGRAELFLQVGLSLEHAFVPGLLEAARNNRLQPGKPGFVTVFEGFEAIEVPEDSSRRDAADVHPMGNPHVTLSPDAGERMASRILEGLIGVDPKGADVYRANHGKYVVELKAARARWAKIGKRLEGAKLVTYHREFSYLARAWGIAIVAQVESRPGVPPTPGHLADLVKRIEQEGVRAIATAHWSNDRSVRFLVERTDAVALELPTMVGASARATSWIAMMDEIHERLAAALLPDWEPTPEPADGDVVRGTPR